MCWRWAAGGSSLSVSRCRMAAKAAPGRPLTPSSIAGLTTNLGCSGSGGGGREPLERGLAPGDEAVRRLLAHHLAPLLRVVTGLGQRPLVLHDMPGGLHHHGAGRVEPGPARAPGDLVELPRLQQPGLAPV